MTETRKCTGIHGCGKVKPVSEFYQRTDGTYLTPCRACKRKYQLRRNNKPTQSPQHERDFVAECRRRGIVADHGKAFNKFAHVDVVCFGAVRVEVKLAHYYDKQPSFHFSMDQQRRGIQGDVVVFMLPNSTGYTYHFFSPQFFKFYRYRNQKRRLKSAVSLVNPSHKHSKRNPSSLTEHDMRNAQNQWHLLYPESIRHFVAPIDYKSESHRQLELI